MSGALVLDSEGLAKAVQRKREVHEWLTAARDADPPVITSAAVFVEVIPPLINDTALSGGTPTRPVPLLSSRRSVSSPPVPRP